MAAKAVRDGLPRDGLLHEALSHDARLGIASMDTMHSPSMGLAIRRTLHGHGEAVGRGWPDLDLITPGHGGSLGR
jgi:hypothetical protein